MQFYSVNQERSGVEISGKLNLPMPLDVPSNFSVNGAYNTISGWQKLHIHVGGERTSPCTVDAICSMAGGVATKDLSQVWEAAGSVSPVWEALTCLSIGKTRMAQIQTGQKAAEVKCPRLAGCQV